jgi:hypothetical protein
MSSFAHLVRYALWSIIEIQYHCFHTHHLNRLVFALETHCVLWAETEFVFIMMQNFGVQLICLRGLQEQKMDLMNRSARAMLY